jgi:hypothetical protein
MKEAKLMGRIRSTVIAAACAAVLFTPALSTAQPADRTTYVTFSGPVSIPGATLPAGTYTFRIADSPANRHIVQILDRDGSKVFATLLAVPAERPQPSGEPVITFKETPSDRPPAVRYWYYAGEKDGNELVYPKAQAMMIARASGEPVMSVDSDSNDIEAWKKGEVSRVTSDSTQPTSASTPTTAPSTAAPTTTAPTTSQPTTTQPTTTPPTTAEPTATAPTATAPSAAAPQSEQPVGTSGRSDASALPRTASDLPMTGLIGLLALLGAGAAHVVRKALV